MGKAYCKAYYWQDLRQFGDWTEKYEDKEAVLTDETIIYLWDDFTVTSSPTIPEQGLIFAHVTPEWQAFCHSTLHFEIPEYLRAVPTESLISEENVLPL